MQQNNSKRLRMTGRERILFARHAALYLRAGIPILEAFELIHASGGSINQKRMLRQLIDDLREGTSLSHALSKFPRVYGPMHLQLISAGEMSGTLSASLSSLARMLDERAQRIRSIVGVLAYPLVLFLAAVGVSIFLLLYAFPKIVPIFRGLHAALPFTTRALIGASSFLQSHWLALLCINFSGAVFSMWAFRHPRAKKNIDSFMLRLPFVGKLLRQAVMVFVFRTIATLLASGIRLDEAIRLVSDGVSNTVFKAALERTRAAILSGNKLSVALSAESFLFPPVAIQLVSVGEMTGTLSESAASVVSIIEEEFAERLRLFSSLLEPVIMITMGLVIGFIALAIISPMYGITQNLSS